MKSLKGAIFILVVGCVMSCAKVNVEPTPVSRCDSLNVSYSAFIAPLFERSCATGTGPGTGCHDAWIFNYKSVHGRVIDGTLKQQIVITKDMPPPGNNFQIPALTAEEIEKVDCW
ncbi:hypothetical protein JYU20_02890, partial [Bacteroidales bacterium AH-315-I05]|nr:hypothetical protein [Bacteroidales bacterium AH-315-I05]